MINTYLFGVEDDIKRDGRIHPTAMLHGTVTGRLSFRDPPMQTIPKDYIYKDDVADLGMIRSLFAATPPSEANGWAEYEIMEADHSQIELYMAAFVSGDQQLWEDLRSGDLHARAAKAMFHLTEEAWDALSQDSRDLHRFNSKFVTYGTMYGRSVVAVATELHCSIQEADGFVRGFFNRYKDYSKWWHETQRKVLTEGELVSATGRKRRFRLTLPGADRASALRMAVNFPLQCPASDNTLAALIELHRTLARLDSYVL